MAAKGCFSAIVLTAAALGIAPGTEAQSAGIPMTVVVHNEAGVTADVLDRAQTLVSRVFDNIGVDVTWMDVAAFARSMPIAAEERRAFVNSLVQIRILSRSMTNAMALTDKSLGFAVAQARFAWVAFDKVRDSAWLADVHPADALGYVMAHEIGHLLLPPNSHSAAGLMRKDLDQALISHNRVRFLDTEAVRIRATLEERIKRLRTAR